MKLLGSLLIIFASVFSSFFYEMGLKEVIKNTEALCDLIKHIKAKIEYFSLPIKDILNEYSKENEFIKNLIDNNFEFNKASLDKEVINEVKAFFNSIGKGYKKEQISLCEYTESILIASKERLKEEFPKKKKLFQALSLFFGVGCVILLI